MVLAILEESTAVFQAQLKRAGIQVSTIRVVLQNQQSGERVRNAFDHMTNAHYDPNAVRIRPNDDWAKINGVEFIW